MTIDGLSLTTFGPLVGVVVVIFWALVKGTLVVKPVHDAAKQEGAYWREAFFKEQAAHYVTTAQNSELLEGVRLQRARIEAAEQVFKEKP